MTRSSLAILAGTTTAVVAGLFLLRSPEPDYSKINVATTTDLERELGMLRDRLDIPGMSAAIAEEDRIIWAHGFGYADLDRRVQVNPETTSFHLASVTKPFTATVALQLADEGRLDVDSSVSQFGVEMPREVRVGHLLSHTSGRRPGSGYRYDARAFGELTTVVERASGRPFAAELTDRIIRKIGLTHTGPNPHEVDRAACRARLSARVLRLCGTEQQAERARHTFGTSGLDRVSIEADLAVGYARQWGRDLWPAGLVGPMRPEQHLTDLFASAGLVASAGDVLRFSIALDQGMLLKASSLARMYTPALHRTGETTLGMGMVSPTVSGPVTRVAFWTGVREFGPVGQDPRAACGVRGAREFGRTEPSAAARGPWRCSEVPRSDAVFELVPQWKATVVEPFPTRGPTSLAADDGRRNNEPPRLSANVMPLEIRGNLDIPKMTWAGSG